MLLSWTPEYVDESVAELGRATVRDALEAAAVRGCVIALALDGRSRVVPAAAIAPPSFSAARMLARRFVADDDDAAGAKELAGFATSAYRDGTKGL